MSIPTTLGSPFLLSLHCTQFCFFLFYSLHITFLLLRRFTQVHCFETRNPFLWYLHIYSIKPGTQACSSTGNSKNNKKRRENLSNLKTSTSHPSHREKLTNKIYPSNVSYMIYVSCCARRKGGGEGIRGENSFNER